MLHIISFQRALDMTPFANSKDKRNKYILYKNYALIQVKRKEKYFNFHITNIGPGKSLIFCHIPELYIVGRLQHDRAALLEFLRISPETNSIFQNSIAQKPGLPYISELNDITSEKTPGKMEWCIAASLLTNICPQMFADGTSEFRLIFDVMTRLMESYDIFQKAFALYMTHGTKSPLINSFKAKKSEITIKLAEEQECGPQFLGKGINGNDLKDFVDKHKVVLVGPDRAQFSIGSAIPKHYVKDECTLVIKSDIFIKGSPWYYSIKLKPSGSGWWIPSIFTGEINDMISKILNHTNTRKYGKIPLSAYKIMPETSKLWFYSNPEHEDIMLHRFVEDGETGPHFHGDVPLFKVDGQYLCAPYWSPLSNENIWTEMARFSMLLNLAFTVTFEFIAYIPFYYAETFNEMGLKFWKGVKLGLNPAKSIFDALRGKKST